MGGLCSPSKSRWRSQLGERQVLRTRIFVRGPRIFDILDPYPGLRLSYVSEYEEWISLRQLASILVQYHVSQSVNSLDWIFISVPHVFQIREFLFHQLRRIIICPQMRLPVWMEGKAGTPRFHPFLSRLSMTQRYLMKYWRY